MRDLRGPLEALRTAHIASLSAAPGRLQLSRKTHRDPRIRTRECSKHLRCRIPSRHTAAPRARRTPRPRYRRAPQVAHRATQPPSLRSLSRTTTPISPTDTAPARLMGRMLDPRHPHHIPLHDDPLAARTRDARHPPDGSPPRPTHRPPFRSTSLRNSTRRLTSSRDSSGQRSLIAARRAAHASTRCVYDLTQHRAIIGRKPLRIYTTILLPPHRACCNLGDSRGNVALYQRHPTSRPEPHVPRAAT